MNKPSDSGPCRKKAFIIPRLHSLFRQCRRQAGGVRTTFLTYDIKVASSHASVLYRLPSPKVSRVNRRLCREAEKLLQKLKHRKVARQIQNFRLNKMCFIPNFQLSNTFLAFWHLPVHSSRLERDSDPPERPEVKVSSSFPPFPQAPLCSSALVIFRVIFTGLFIRSEPDTGLNISAWADENQE